ncbi:hypothetical protein CCACVL1_02326 [Corchorus capsularis]|uniref:Uncharacterized protein n=1 Tax=Corchorus capsularis TaxID=210143 RepID=A0A1R3K959_COCAP|nr:hypothetical protein CCACVL1_18323 [Corchorus capsularis]OMO80689.1 hypothetical protein CCACVL1_12815 [Corchorus capsularis]OMP03640.1 hypothetical protein CCACVL1_02326 [Corchorus capsularis]
MDRLNFEVNRDGSHSELRDELKPDKWGGSGRGNGQTA